VIYRVFASLISCLNSILTPQGDKTEKKKYEPPVPTRVGKKRKKVKVRIRNMFVLS
jgi:hypothetical protein